MVIASHLSLPFHTAHTIQLCQMCCVSVCACVCFDVNFVPENLKWCFLFRQKSNEIIVTRTFSQLTYQNVIIYPTLVRVCVFAVWCCYKNFSKYMANQVLTLSRTHSEQINKQIEREKEKKVSTSKCVWVCGYEYIVYLWSFEDGLLFLLNLNWTMDIIYKSFHFGCKQHHINDLQKNIKSFSWNSHLIKTEIHLHCLCCCFRCRTV